MMKVIAIPLWGTITVCIYVLSALGITAEWGASRLTGPQKFWAKFLRANK